MAQPLYRQYLQQARRLAQLDPTRPKQGNLRRALSTAYYALFHFLVDCSTRLLVGDAGERKQFRKALARTYEHGEMARVAKTFSGGVLPASIQRHVGALLIPNELRDLCATFLDIQEQRHLADYDLTEAFRREEVLGRIDDVERAIDSWDSIAPEPAARFFLICLLTWDRMRNK